MFRVFTVFLMSLALTACGQATLAPTALSSKRPTLMLTEMPSTRPSATVTLTPFPTLGSKPYLLIWQDRKSQEFSIYDTSGGRKTIELPSDGHVKGINSTLNSIVSPDGKWLVFYTGYTHYIDSNSHSTSKIPVTLKLLNILARLYPFEI